MALEYYLNNRVAKEGDLIQNIPSGDVWRALCVSGKGDVLIQDIFDEDNDSGNYVFLEKGSYWVLEKA